MSSRLGRADATFQARSSVSSRERVSRRPLCEEVAPERLAKVEEARLAGRKRIRPDDVGEIGHLARPSGERVQLGGDLEVVVARLPWPCSEPHEARERPERVERRVDPAHMQLRVEYELPFGDVAGEVGHRMRDVAGGHRHHGQLR